MPYSVCSILATVNNAVMNMGVKISLWYPIFTSLYIYLQVGLLDHMVVLFLIFWGTFIQFSLVVTLIYSPISSTKSSLFFTSLLILVITCLFYWPHGLWDLSSKSGIAPGPSAMKAQSPNHWTFREFPHLSFLKNLIN